MTLERTLIVGASHAGAQLAASLRQEGWTGEIVLIGDEAALPYQRPPLSKAYLAGKCTVDELAIRNAEFYTKQRIQLLDATVEAIDRSAGQLSLNTGDALPYDKLALCTGARPRRLPTPGADLAGVFYLRTAADVEMIREATSPGSRAVIVGGGYIGLETAASLRALGLEVTVIEATERVLERVTAPEVSAFFDRIHREEGVNIRTGALVKALSGDGRIREVILAGGESIPADLVIVGIGVEPNTELAAAAGLVVDNGVVIDDQARTSDPAIVAAGDCASHDMARYGRRIRLESVPSAAEQAKVAAATVCGKSKKISALPWFWSDQYDLKLQIAGLNTGYDEVILSGDPTRDRDFTCFYLRAGELIAADCINRPRDFMVSKRIITQQLPIGRSELVLAGSA
ncbi:MULTISPECIES: NAD(P)/FAD-dependent oxidoreductase [Mycobacteriaceae]|uniref:Pyridine nucleotide-disulfide oxidoreductase n=2 Tax=Mycobacteriaceae TaxID=1762 RepID=A0A1X0DZJ2_9MYCO|nr:MULTISPECIES: FAD-dependent oxidoreductase [Mycobacteriaceae]ORA77876.1 pyridine nucleotide-disulfide oxidoreductase [Mycolicibacter kumamotonensis]WJR32583.1 FAD-dependent oxidoreductase [Mycobacteroides immunogenum]SKM20828.1 FAD-dependent pyridine nucleotide-disulfide oxidoreductase [Mycobacteroides abscessus subsp. massiliense]SKT01981.1 FAD-dependent pyridine nucleotide-disulfide oxidoreductase [Mycobacteroides abscessus subsp. massiliense]SKT63232.1 FAD-dependent pyridine nucleotide-d